MSEKRIFASVDGKADKVDSETFVSEGTENMAQSSSGVYFSVNQTIRGYFKISNQYRPGFSKVIQQFGLQYDMYLLSGDNDSEQEHLQHFFNKDKIFFNQQPQQKIEFIAGLRKTGRRVLMTGDGLNDSGAFMQSDVALSVANDIYHFSPAGDAIIEASQFHRLTSFIGFARKSLLIVKIVFGISFYTILLA